MELPEGNQGPSAVAVPPLVNIPYMQSKVVDCPSHEGEKSAIVDQFPADHGTPSKNEAPARQRLAAQGHEDHKGTRDPQGTSVRTHTIDELSRRIGI